MTETITRAAALAQREAAAGREIITKPNAKAAGLRRYFTGKPCAKGHVSERRTANGECVECERGRHGAWQKANPESSRAYTAKWAATNRECKRTASAAWNTANPGRVNALAAERRARRLHAVCQHCTFKQRAEFYVMAAQMSAQSGVTYEIDHVQSYDQNGRHCSANLQILTDEVHREKTKREHVAASAAKKQQRKQQRKPVPNTPAAIMEAS